MILFDQVFHSLTRNLLWCLALTIIKFCDLHISTKVDNIGVALWCIWFEHCFNLILCISVCQSIGSELLLGMDIFVITVRKCRSHWLLIFARVCSLLEKHFSIIEWLSNSYIVWQNLCILQIVIFEQLELRLGNKSRMFHNEPCNSFTTWWFTVTTLIFIEIYFLV